MTSTLLALVLTTASLALVVLLLLSWLVLRVTRSLQEQQNSLHESLLATSSQTSAMASLAISEMTTQQAKALGAMTAQTVKLTSGLLSQNETTTTLLADTITLLSSKDPMAYSQLRQTQVATDMSGDAGQPYTSGDEIEATRLEQEMQQQAIQEDVNITLPPWMAEAAGLTEPGAPYDATA